ncbi:Methyltransferase type 11 domain-containing protein [Entamoeba marina]
MDITPEVETKNVREVYEVIASHFSTTRYKGWPMVEEFLNTRQKYSIVLDVGCGNGKYHNINKDLYMVGFDPINCQPKSQNVQADGLSIPVVSNTANAAICVAVIHHFSSVERRVAAIQEILRTLQVGGQALFSVWAKEQKKFEKSEGQDIMVPWHLDGSDDPEQVFHRYYHVFVKGELEDVVSQVKGCKLVYSGYERDNWYVVIEKV